MRLAVLLLVIVACEKQGPVERTPGTSSSSMAGTATPTVQAIDAGVATIGTDAAVVAPAPADADVAISPDAAVRRPDRAPISTAEDELRRYADLLASDGTGAVDSDLAKRRPGSDLGRQLAERAPGKVATPVNSPRGHITISSKQAFDESSLLTEMVVAKISTAYMAGLKRCYKTYLQKEPMARGKVVLTLAVNEAGRAIAPKASGFAGPIDDCIKSQMASWRFPVPKDKDGEATAAGFQIGLRLVPD